MRVFIYRETLVQKNNLIFVMSLFVLFITSISTAHALNFDIEPSIFLKSTYTDNEKQSTEPTSQDIISEISPAIAISATGVRTTAELDYALRKQVSYTQDIDKLDHELHGNGSFDLIKNYVNLFANGNYEQRQNQVSQNILFDDSAQFEDTADFGTISAGTEFSNQSKRYFDANMRYIFNISKSNSTTFTDTSSHKMVASMKNGKKFHRLSWGGNANYEELNDANLDKKKIAEVTGDVGYLIQPHNGLRLTLGYESNPQYKQVDPNLKHKGMIATATAFWRSPKSFGFEAMAGKRAYGKTYHLKSDWKSSTTNLTASYGRSIVGNNFAVSLQQKIHQATFRLQYNEMLSEYNYVSFIQNTLEESEEETLLPPEPLLPSIQTGTFIVRRASSGMTLQGIKNTLDFSADYETKTYTESGTDSRTYKAKAEWKSEINMLANTNFSVEAIDANDSTLGVAGLYGLVKLSYEHRIKKYFLTTLSAQHWQHRLDNAETITVNLLNVSVKASY